MTTLVVLAHPDARSFNGHWARASMEAFRSVGEEVVFSDLCADGFDAVEAARLYPAFPDATQFDPLKAQEEAARNGGLPADVAREVEKLRAADRVIFHFPLWWFAPPAVLKGWCDRVLVHGLLHDVDNRFDRGRFRGRKALFCVTTGADEAESGHDGREGDARLQLWPLAITLRYCGFDVCEPLFAHGVHGYFTGADRERLEARLRDILSGHAAIADRFDALPLMRFNADADFDASGRLRKDAPSHSPFIRHEL
jgi:NAD(P)H dehydrogenase (quinone)